MKGISDLLDSDMEETPHFIDENSILSSASDAPTANSTQEKKPKKRHRVTMPAKSKSKVQKPVAARSKKAASKQTAAAKRAALEEHINEQDLHEPDVMGGSEGEQQAEAPRAKKGGRGVTKSNTTKKAATSKQRVEPDEALMEVEQSPVNRSPKHAPDRNSSDHPKATRKPAAAHRPKASQKARALEQDAQDSVVEDEEQNAEAETKAPVPKPKVVVHDTSRTRQEPPYRRRAGSASDTDRGDPNLRRKLGDVTRKFENVDLKYRNLKDVGVNEANANMEKLRRQCDATMQASNDLVASLKKELAAQAPLAHESRRLKEHMQNQEVEINNMRAATAELTHSLGTAQNEIKALQAKLAAARASSVEKTTSKVPASAIKPHNQRPVMMANAEAAQIAQVAQMKEDLYSDLTGLIIRGVKRTDEGDTYDCIQTGRNGSKSQYSRPPLPKLIAPQRCTSSSMSIKKMQETRVSRRPSFSIHLSWMPTGIAT
jgi:hypothetical protein